MSKINVRKSNTREKDSERKSENYVPLRLTRLHFFAVKYTLLKYKL